MQNGGGSGELPDFDAGYDTEVWSSPQEPFVGMEFDSLMGAKAHYNVYALSLGFSVKSNTSRRSAYTGVLEKHTFYVDWAT